nr:GTPase [Arthrobacter sp. zg-Y1116]
MVFTGQYSSGKSTLIKALTQGEAGVVIGSGVTTDAVEEFDWDGDVRLVDTPGVHAGRPHHDDLAEKALQSADLVLFAVTVELFDNVLSEHLRDVIGRLGKSRQTMIVVTKSGTMGAAEGVRDAAIRDALGSFDKVPWVECDAQYYLDGLALAPIDEAASRAFVEESGLDNVASLINRFAAQQGEQGTLRQPLQHIAALAFQSIADLTDDPDEQAALTVLSRQHSALAKKRIHLNSLLEARAGEFRKAAGRAATRFADHIESNEQQNGLQGSTDDEHDKALATLNDDLGGALVRFEDAVRQLLEVQFDDLASEILEIEASPFGRISVGLGEAATSGFEAPNVAVRRGGPPHQQMPGWAGGFSQHLKKFNEVWGAGTGTRAAAGSVGHKVVFKVGKAFHKKFKPWEAVRLANNVGKIAKAGNVVFTVGQELYGVVADERSAVKAERERTQRHRDITEQILAQADGIVMDALRTVNDSLEDLFGPELQRIDRLAQEIHGTRTTRSGYRERLLAVRERAQSTLTTLSSANSKALQYDAGAAAP